MLPTLTSRPTTLFGAAASRNHAAQQPPLRLQPPADMLTFGSKTEKPQPLSITLSPELAHETKEFEGIYKTFLQKLKSGEFYPPHYQGVLSRLNQNGWSIQLDVKTPLGELTTLNFKKKVIHVAVDTSSDYPHSITRQLIAQGIAQAINYGALREKPLRKTSKLQLTRPKLSDSPEFQRVMDPILAKAYETTNRPLAKALYLVAKMPASLDPEGQDPDPSGQGLLENRIKQLLLGQDESPRVSNSQREARSALYSYVNELLDPYYL